MRAAKHPLHSQVMRGEVFHARLGPKKHQFRYPHTFFCFDLSELSQISQASSWFSYNQRNFLSLRDQDYLYGQQRPIVEQLAHILPPVEESQYQHWLLTSPRYLGYAFNPVNFHLRLADKNLVAVVAEVNNTFGDRHIYPLTSLEQTASDTWEARCPKDFHVSPFNDLQGVYHFRFQLRPESVRCEVDLHRDQHCVLKTWIQGEGHPLTTGHLAKYALAHPFDTALNSLPRITWQAAKLHYLKKLPIFARPRPSSPQSLKDRDQPEPSGKII
tara:strand:- start:225 stop:1040 length:816 start_codon:yes stop_codon:yes gene_type:complete